MSDLLSRMVQRAIQPGGGLEPLRPSRTSLQAAASWTGVPELAEVEAGSRDAKLAPLTQTEKAASERAHMTTVQSAPLSRRVDGTPHYEPHAQESASAKETGEKQESGSKRQDNVAAIAEVLLSAQPPDMRPVSQPVRQTNAGEPPFAEVPVNKERLLRAEPALTPVAIPSWETSPRLEEQVTLTEPRVEISIGHIEVQIAAPAPERPRRPAFRPQVSLTDYLNRSAGPRR